MSVNINQVGSRIYELSLCTDIGDLEWPWTA